MTRTCSVFECDRPIHGGRLCKMHGQRLRRSGTTDPPRRETIAERFWAKVDRRAADECWPWTAHCSADGYGRFGSPPRNAHVVAWELTFGPIPDGHEIDHVRSRGCTNTKCVNPAHLEPVTPHENWRRSDCVSSLNARKTQCTHGHPLSGANLSRPRRGGRACKTCNRRRTAEYAARLRREAGALDNDQEDTD